MWSVDENVMSRDSQETKLVFPLGKMTVCEVSVGGNFIENNCHK